MAIEVAPKREVKKEILLFTILSFSIAVFLVFIISYFYLDYSSKKISQDIQLKEKALLKTPEQGALENKLLLYETKINNFAKLLENHKKPLNIFNFLEKFTHPNVWFYDFSFSSNNMVAEVSAEAKSFQDVGQQLMILSESNVFKEINLESISVDERGTVSFSLQLIFKPEILE